MRAVVLSAGQIADYARVLPYIGEPDLIICADGGIRHAEALGLTPHLLLGDFDSADAAAVAAAEAQGVPVHRVPVEKDQTDTHMALEEAVRRGAREILLLGGTGDRLDHTFSNLLLMPGVHAAVTVVDARNVIRLLRPGGRLTIAGSPGDYISLLPLTPEARGVVIEGVRWPLENATLRWGESLGVSNRLMDSEAFVAVREGYILVIQAWD